MSLKDSLGQQLDRLSRELVPALREALDEGVSRARRKLDLFNRSLADRALPEDRKSRVGKLNLQRKAEMAGQGKRGRKAVKSSRKGASKGGKS